MHFTTEGRSCVSCEALHCFFTVWSSLWGPPFRVLSGHNSRSLMIAIVLGEVFKWHSYPACHGAPSLCRVVVIPSCARMNKTSVRIKLCPIMWSEYLDLYTSTQAPLRPSVCLSVRVSIRLYDKSDTCQIGPFIFFFLTFARQSPSLLSTVVQSHFWDSFLALGKISLTNPSPTIAIVQCMHIVLFLREILILKRHCSLGCTLN